MSYQQRLSEALQALGEGDDAAALAALGAAEAEAARVDPEGPRVAEVLNYTAQVQMQAGRAREARAALERVCAIWERFPQLSEGLADYYLQLMGLCTQLDDEAGAQRWREKARAASAARPEKPWR